MLGFRFVGVLKIYYHVLIDRFFLKTLIHQFPVVIRV